MCGSLAGRAFRSDGARRCCIHTLPSNVGSCSVGLVATGSIVVVAPSRCDVCAQAIQAWRDSTGFGRAQLVKSYFSAVAGFTEPEAVTQVDVQVRIQLSCPVGALKRRLVPLSCGRSPSECSYIVQLTSPIP